MEYKLDSHADIENLIDEVNLLEHDIPVIAIVKASGTKEFLPKTIRMQIMCQTLVSQAK